MHVIDQDVQMRQGTLEKHASICMKQPLQESNGIYQTQTRTLSVIFKKNLFLGSVF